MCVDIGFAEYSVLFQLGSFEITDAVVVQCPTTDVVTYQMLVEHSTYEQTNHIPQSFEFVCRMVSDNAQHILWNIVNAAIEEGYRCDTPTSVIIQLFRMLPATLVSGECERLCVFPLNPQLQKVCTITSGGALVTTHQTEGVVVTFGYDVSVECESKESPYSLLPTPTLPTGDFEPLQAPQQYIPSWGNCDPNPKPLLTISDLNPLLLRGKLQMRASSVDGEFYESEKSIFTRPIALYSYTVASTQFNYFLPFEPALQRIVSSDFLQCAAFLDASWREELLRLIAWAKIDSVNYIKSQHDQDVVIITHSGVGVPTHKHGIRSGRHAITYCFKLTDVHVSISPTLRIGTVHIPVFPTIERTMRVMLNTHDVDHEVIVDPKDENLYFWFIRDGVILKDGAVVDNYTIPVTYFNQAI